jgi:hypothetical protein
MCPSPADESAPNGIAANTKLQSGCRKQYSRGPVGEVFAMGKTIAEDLIEKGVAEDVKRDVRRWCGISAACY